jgi:hypothetical protein
MQRRFSLALQNIISRRNTYEREPIMMIRHFIDEDSSDSSDFSCDSIVNFAVNLTDSLLSLSLFILMFI